MAVLRRVTLVALALLVGSGCVLEGKCVEPGATRGPDGRCRTGPPGSDAGRTDAGTSTSDGGTDAFVPTTDAGGDLCDPVTFVGDRGGQCANPQDEEARSRADYGPTMSWTLFDVAKNCAEACFADDDTESCVAGCMVDITEGSLTVGCGECYGAMGECVLAHCVTACGSAPESEACQSCLCGETACLSCYEVAQQCGGFTGPFCDGGSRACEMPLEPFPPEYAPRCSGDTVTCLETCGGDTECMYACLEDDPTPPATRPDGIELHCVDCIVFSQFYCADANGCHDQVAAYNCCAVDFGPGAAECQEISNEIGACLMSTDTCYDLLAPPYDVCWDI